MLLGGAAPVPDAGRSPHFRGLHVGAGGAMGGLGRLFLGEELDADNLESMLRYGATPCWSLPVPSDTLVAK